MSFQHYIAFQSPLPLRLTPTHRFVPQPVARRPRTKACTSNEDPSPVEPVPTSQQASSPSQQPSPLAKNSRRAFLIAAAAASLATLTPSSPPPAHSLGLAPTPINPYAKRRRERAYKEYAQKLEKNLEMVGMADFRKVVEAGGGGLGVSYRVAGFAAFVASAMSTAVVHPIDSIKTRMQMWGVNDKLFDGVYNGLWSNVMKEAPNAAIYLGVYELIKNGLMNLEMTSFFHDLPLITFLVAGALGDAIGSIVRVPAEIVNKRLQLGVNSNWKEALRDAFFSKQGREASSVAWQAVLWRDVPYGGLQIMLYEFGKLWLQNHPALLGGHFSQPGIWCDVIIGALAGAVAAMVTTPADLLVTKLSVQHPQSYLETRKYMGVGSTARRILAEDGIGGFFKGTWQRGLYYAPMIGLFFALYELNRMWLAHPQSIVTGFQPLLSILREEWRMLPEQVAAIYSVLTPVLGGVVSLFSQQLPLVASFGTARSQM